MSAVVVAGLIARAVSDDEVRRILIVVSLATAVACDRPQDDLEPNDTFDTATSLVEGQKIEAIAHEDNRDVFRFTAPAMKTIVFTLKPIEYEVECTAFEVDGPDRVAIAAPMDPASRCGDESFDPSDTRLTHAIDTETGVHQISVRTESSAGDYFFIARAVGQADNQLEFAVRYELGVALGDAM